jgi:hypothetical protein
VSLRATIISRWPASPQDAEVLKAVETLPSRKSSQADRARELIIEEQGSELLLYLTLYSPLFNPVEETFSKIERYLRGVSTRTGEELAKAVGKGPGAIAVKDVPGSARRVYRTLETPARCSATARDGSRPTRPNLAAPAAILSYNLS